MRPSMSPAKRRNRVLQYSLVVLPPGSRLRVGAGHASKVSWNDRRADCVPWGGEGRASVNKSSSSAVAREANPRMAWVRRSQFIFLSALGASHRCAMGLDPDWADLIEEGTAWAIAGAAEPPSLRQSWLSLRRAP